MKTRCIRLLVGSLILLLGLALMPSATLAQDEVTESPVVADAVVEGNSLVWQLQIDYEYSQARLVISGPDNLLLSREFSPGEAIRIDIVDDEGERLPVGSYTYELLVTPAVSETARTAFEKAVETRDNRVVEILQAAGELPVGPFAQSGAFAIADEAIIVAEAQSPAPASGDIISDQDVGPLARDNRIQDDLIVVGSTCTGTDCVNGEVFSFDTLRLKENNLQIHFNDTSSSSSFPTRDWRIIANDSANGGANYLAFEDSDVGTKPFRVDANAGNNALRVSSQGNVGLGTSNPLLDLHITGGNTPSVRLEQDGSNGFTSQTWDIAGNEANFFIRDATNSSKIPFKIQPNSPNNSLVIESSTGDIGLGTVNPDADLHVIGKTLIEPADSNTTAAASVHVRATDGTAKILVEEASGTVADRTLLELKNNRKTFLSLNDTRSVNTVNIGANQGRLTFDLGGTTRLVQSDTDGTLSVNGNLVLSGGSCTGCRSVQAFALSATDILDRLAQVSINNWTGTGIDVRSLDETIKEIDVVHVTPDMQSFYNAYGLGLNGEQIAPLDVATISFAATQALNEQLQEQQTIIAQQAALIEDQAQQLSQMETLLLEMEARLQSVESMAHSHTYLPSIETK